MSRYHLITTERKVYCECWEKDAIVLNSRSTSKNRIKIRRELNRNKKKKSDYSPSAYFLKINGHLNRLKTDWRLKTTKCKSATRQCIGESIQENWRLKSDLMVSASWQDSFDIAEKRDIQREKKKIADKLNQLCYRGRDGRS